MASRALAATLVLALGLGLAGCEADPGPAGPCGVPGAARGALVWSDEFDGDAVDARRWRVRDATRLSFDDASIRAANVAVRDGALYVTARRAPAGAARPFTTGYLDTIGTFSRQYGRWEVRARLPVEPGRSRGLWPAFWLRADHRGGEIDVLEAWGTPSRRAQPGDYSWTVHEDTRSRRPGRVQGWGRLADGPAGGGFHDYAVDWTPSCLTFSVDGRATGTVRTSDHPWIEDALDDTVNMRLNLQVGSAYWGRPDAAPGGRTALPASLVVDHVRVYAPPRRDR